MAPFSTTYTRAMACACRVSCGPATGGWDGRSRLCRRRRDRIVLTYGKMALLSSHRSSPPPLESPGTWPTERITVNTRWRCLLASSSPESGLASQRVCRGSSSSGHHQRAARRAGGWPSGSRQPMLSRGLLVVKGGRNLNPRPPGYEGTQHRDQGKCAKSLAAPVFASRKDSSAG